MDVAPEERAAEHPRGGDRTRTETFPIVAIGASAGGLESLERFFTALPADPGMAFVVIQHLSPDFRSMMDELLRRHCEMPVQHAEDGLVVRPDHVYLLPPKKEMVISGGRLILTDKVPTKGLTLPIDTFFRSLAADVGERALAIVLSGTGSDGSRGIHEIARAGGLVLVEDPASAKFDGMPRSALATELVDHVASAESLPALLLGRRAAGGEGSEDEPATPIEAVTPIEPATPIEDVYQLLHEHSGIDFATYKIATVSRRLARRVELAKHADLESYVARLRDDNEELGALYHDLLIGVTQFFRDPEAFEVIEEHVVPDVLRRVPENEEIRVWSAGCATGEEPFSLAMLFHEALERAGRPVHLKVLATDVHRESLERASAATYGEEQLEHVAGERRQRYFERRGGGYSVAQSLRKLVVFARHDATRDAPFTRMHLIACRNFLIYLEPKAQKRVLSLFHFGLVNGGYLFLGASEATGPLGPEFAPVDEHWRVYKKRRDVRLLDAAHLPILPLTGASTAPQFVKTAPRSADTHLLATYDKLLDRHMPPSFLVDEEGRLIDSFGGAERLLRVGRRRPSSWLVELLPRDLATLVSGVLQKAQQRARDGKGAIRFSGVPLPDDLGLGPQCALSAEGFRNERLGTSHVLITLESVARSAARPVEEYEPGSDVAAHVSRERIQGLESDLTYTRETLQSTIEELQTSNEELQATNEELVASNEELQSTNEELHSVNEELHTLNTHHQRKIVELRELNNDIQHLLEGTDVGTLFLDSNLRIRKFTPRVAEVFRIQDQDVGRSISDFFHSLRRPTLMSEIEAALRDGTRIEDEVRDDAGTPFFLRILPYRPEAVVDDEREGPQPLPAIEGVVLSLTNIASLDAARARLAEMSAIVESSEDAIIGKRLDGTITTWNRGAERLYGYTAEEVVGRNIRLLAPPGRVQEIERFLEALGRGEKVDHVDTIRLRKDGTRADVAVTVSPVYDRQGRIVGGSAIARDVSQVKRAQRELRRREMRIREILESTMEAIYGVDPDGVCTFCNPSCARALGYESVDELVGKDLHELAHCTADGAPVPRESCAILAVLRSGEGAHADDQHMRRADGTTFPVEYWSRPVLRDGRIAGAVVSFLDVTERKQSEEELRTTARRREEFLALLSHELRNPLAAVVNASALLRADGGNGSLEDALDVIQRQVAHMARLLDDLLDVTRIGQGRIDVREEEVDLRRVCGAAIEAVSPLFGDRGDELAVELPDEPLPVRGDPDRLRQVVSNLLTNAARHSDEGAAIRLAACAEEDELVLSVSDDGHGIDPERLDRIFELFVQGEQGLDRASGGLGIGLTVVRKIVELHGGTVAAHSDGIGRGSEFVVRLPRSRTPAAGSAGESGAPRERRIVLVEDQADARRMLRLLLEKRGHVVTEAADGEAALDAIRRERPDVALVDIGLPLLDGYAVARSVRGDDDLSHVFLVALTGYGAADDVDAARESGFDAHLTKPADLARLEELLATCRPGR